MLVEWDSKRSFTLQEAAELCGVLESISRYNRWGRAWFFASQNAVRFDLKKRYFILERQWNRSKIEKRYKRYLPARTMDRLTQLVDAEKARLLWESRVSISMDESVRACLANLRQYLADFNRQWEEPIAFIIDRDHHIESVGDASKAGGGDYCPTLRFWFDLVWSARVKRGLQCKLIHINVLEFIVMIIQLAAVIVRLENMIEEQAAAFFPDGVPSMPLLMARTDNTSSETWANHSTTKSPLGQHFVGIWAELLRLGGVGTKGKWIKGILNVLADFISSPYPLQSFSRGTRRTDLPKARFAEDLRLFPSESRAATASKLLAVYRVSVPELTAIYKEIERWEQVPNRRESFTMEMLQFFKQHVESGSYRPDSLLSVLCDWFEI